MRTLIKNGSIVTSSEQYKADILFENDKIVAIGTGMDDRAETMIDAEGKYIFPGGVDAHTHYAIPFMGTVSAGFDTSAAAAVGGTTTIVDFVPQPLGMSLVDSFYKHKEEQADGKAAIDYSFHAMIMDSANKAMYDELPTLVEAGLPTIKIFMSYKGTSFFCTDDVIFKMMQKTKDVGMLVMLHCENAEVVDVLQQQLVAENKLEPKYHAVSRPEPVETEATARAVYLAQIADAPVFIVHVSCTQAMEVVRTARQNGIAAYGETCPHYLVLDVENLSKPNFEGAKYVLSPALRSAWHFDNMWASIEKGWLQTVGSDHSPQRFDTDKHRGKDSFVNIPNGAPGIQDRLSVLYTYGVLTGKLSLQRMVDVFATAPAKFNGLYPRKGSIVIGGDADLVIFDPKWTGKMGVASSLQAVDFNLYEGFTQNGRPEIVFLRGNMIVEDGKYIGQLGQGAFLKAEPYGAAYDGLK